MFNEKDLEFIFGTRGLGVNDIKKVNRYPLTNIGTDSEGNLIAEIAVAGFDKSELSIESKGNEIHITGEKSTMVNEVDINYVQKHISSEDFERILVLHDNYVGGDVTAKVENGLLTLKVTPKEPTKKLITID